MTRKGEAGVDVGVSWLFDSFSGLCFFADERSVGRTAKIAGFQFQQFRVMRRPIEVKNSQRSQHCFERMIVLRKF